MIRISVAGPIILNIAVNIAVIVTALNVHEVRAEEGPITGVLTVVGNGPERPFIERLATAFEKAYPGTAIDIRWGYTLRLAEIIKSGEADIGVSDHEEPGTSATTIAWEGIAVIVNFANPVKEVTTKQLHDLFSGTTAAWSELHERGEGKIEVAWRPDDRHLNYGLDKSLNLDHTSRPPGSVLRSDQAALNRVSGRLSAISYLSLQAALDAVIYGTPIRLLIVERVEPAMPTVKSGRYPLRRPIVIVTRQLKPLAKTFLNFFKSPEGRRLTEKFYIPDNAS